MCGVFSTSQMQAQIHAMNQMSPKLSVKSEIKVFAIPLHFTRDLAAIFSSKLITLAH